MSHTMFKPKKETTGNQQYTGADPQTSNLENLEGNTLGPGGELQSTVFDMLPYDLLLRLLDRVKGILKIAKAKEEAKEKAKEKEKTKATPSFSKLRRSNAYAFASTTSSTITETKEALQEASTKETAEEVFQALKDIRDNTNDLDQDIKTSINDIFTDFTEEVASHDQLPNLTLEETNPLRKTTNSIEKESVVCEIKRIRSLFSQSASMNMDPKDTDNLISEAGHLIMDYLISITGAKEKKEALDQAIQTYIPLKKQLDHANENTFWKIYLSPDAIAGRKALRDAKRDFEGKSHEHATQLKNIMDAIQQKTVQKKARRFVCNNPSLSSSAQGTALSVLKNTIQYFPADWVNASDGPEQQPYHCSTPIKFDVDGDRGGYIAELSLLSLPNTSDENQLVPIAFHELGHRFEDVVPGVFEATSRFFDRRINEHLDENGDPVEIDLTPNIPGATKEIALDGGFFHDYAGVVYRHQDTNKIKHYEIVSMGCQYAYTNPTVLWAKDPDYAAFIYGILALCGQPD